MLASNNKRPTRSPACEPPAETTACRTTIPQSFLCPTRTIRPRARDESRDYHPAVFDDTSRIDLWAVLALEEDPNEDIPVDPDTLIIVQQSESFCKQFMRTVGNLDSSFDLNIEKVLICRSPLDGDTQRVIPQKIHLIVLYQNNYPMHAGHPGGTKIYQPSVSRSIDGTWPKKHSKPYVKCPSCARLGHFRKGAEGNSAIPGRRLAPISRH